MFVIHSTVERRANRMPDTTVETTVIITGSSKWSLELNVLCYVPVLYSPLNLPLLFACLA